MIGPRKVDRPLVLYGFGKLGHLAEEIFNELKIPISMIAERMKLTIKDVYQKPKDVLVAVCIATEPYNKIVEQIRAAGFSESDIVPVWDIIQAYRKIRIRNGWFAGRMTDGERGILTNLYRPGIWADQDSYTHWGTFLQWRINRHDRDIGQSLNNLIPLPSTLADIRSRQRVDIYPDTPLYHVHLHNEGCELKTLEANMHLFKKYRPSIECAVYHSRDGLCLIEKTLMDNLPDYQWTFRLHAYMGQAAYIYGMPKERL